MAALLPTLQERWRDSLYVTRSLPHFIEVSDPLASKSSALAYLCDALGLARERTVACGDGWNDIDMMAGPASGWRSPRPPTTCAQSADLVVPRDELGALFERLAAAPPA